MKPGDMVQLLPVKHGILGSINTTHFPKQIRDDFFIITQISKNMVQGSVLLLHPPTGTKIRCFLDEIKVVE